MIGIVPVEFGGAMINTISTSYRITMLANCSECPYTTEYTEDINLYCLHHAYILGLILLQDI